MGYLEAQEGADARTAFRSAEKQYKRYKKESTQSRRNAKHRTKVPVVDLSQVLDFRKTRPCSSSNSNSKVQLHQEFEWPVYTLHDRPGFFFIPEALDVQQQAFWMQQCVGSFPQPPNRTNHNALYGPVENLWRAAQEDEVLAESSSSSNDNGNNSKWEFVPRSQVSEGVRTMSASTLMRKLRWATIGLQFDWSRKGYDPELPHAPLPPPLAALAARLAVPAGGPGDGGGFRAQAAIVNYYGPDDMLGGHIDDMEEDLSKPIVSISLGCKAIFLLGGETRDEAPIAMFLRSGDVVLMAGPTRRCFHAVPRTFVEAQEADLPDFTSLSPPNCLTDFLLAYIKETRINMNIRQVYA